MLETADGGARVGAETARIASQPRTIACAWAASRAYLFAVALLLGPTTSFRSDLLTYHAWAQSILQTHHLPSGPMWQYPAGAAFLFLVPGGRSAAYSPTFELLMLLFDLGITWTLARLAVRERRFVGVWAWLAMTTVFGPVLLMRFDLVPTLAVVGGLAVLWTSERQRTFGVIVGLGALVKVWPVVALLAARTRRQLSVAVLASAATVVSISAFASLLFGDTLGFIANQRARGLETEAVAATPWFVRDIVTSRPLQIHLGSGSVELTSATGDQIAAGLRVAMLLVAVAIAAWWLNETRAGRQPTASRTRDSVFAAILWYVAVSPVLSPQYMIWLMGVGALVLCAPDTELRTPIALVAAAVVLTRLTMHWPHQLYAAVHVIRPTAMTATILALRNLLLLAGAVESTRRLLPSRRFHR